jgi:GH15 family glucan-1,4-alpha-glucosidase
MSAPLEDYGLVGDLRTAALVDRHGSVDWLCLPRFDGGACFAALLGDRDNGCWAFRPAAGARATGRRYRDGSPVLETDLASEGGEIRIVDFMPTGRETSSLVRIVTGLRGRVEVEMDLAIRFDYGSIVPWVRRLDGDRVAVAGPDGLVLRTPIDVAGRGLRTVARFAVEEGDELPFTLTWFPSNEATPPPFDAHAALTATLEFWRGWAGRCSHKSQWRDAVVRSLVTLKALTDRETGGMVAAPTTSLPEQLGGTRNWDYRFCWLRDATLALLTFLRAGYRDEARAWRDWFLRAIAGSPEALQILYSLDGTRRIPEVELGWLQGYEGSRPVRTGNAAHDQLQLDVWGEVGVVFYESRLNGLDPSPAAWAINARLLDWLDDGWRAEDEGIWEVRGQRRHFTHSKVMTWVAFDRAIRSVERFGLDGPVDRWRASREAIRREVLREGFDVELGAFVQSFGSKRLDAAALLIPLVGFLPATDPRVVSTVAAIERELMRDGLVERYRADDHNAEIDGLPAGEGVFLPCSFWLVSVLALQGRREEAVALMERVLALRNDLGLLSEEYDTHAGRLVGNFPQAFTHLALVDAAHTLGEGRALLTRPDDVDP